jgi:membrane-bound ClpP family serine protease
MNSRIRKILGFLCIALFLALNLVYPNVSAQGQGLVYVVPLTGEIDGAA